MNRLERITSILLLLQSRKKITAQQLADRFETSIRTIYRDIRVLEEAGVPIGAEAGIGYYIMDGYSLPPVLFTKEEAGAMLTAEKLLGKFGDVSLNKEFTSATEKVRAVLRSTDKDFVETLEQHILVQTMRPLVDTGEFPNKFISTIQQALVEQRIIEMNYYAHYNEKATKRIIEPIGLSYVNGSWHLFAWCRLRNAVRDFRPDRIKNLHLLDEKYNKTKHPLLGDVMKELNNPKHLTRIVIRLDNQVSKFDADMKYFLGLVDETKSTTHSELVFKHHSLNNFARWLLHWGNKVEILEPDELKTEMKKLTTELSLHYT
ncbi:MAG: YafY family protein [Bacteroidota bacterium]